MVYVELSPWTDRLLCVHQADQVELTPIADALLELLRAVTQSSTEADALLAFELTSSLLSITQRMDDRCGPLTASIDVFA